MGLAKTVAVRFPEWGPEFATLMVMLCNCNPAMSMRPHQEFTLYVQQYRVVVSQALHVGVVQVCVKAHKLTQGA